MKLLKKIFFFHAVDLEIPPTGILVLAESRPKNHSSSSSSSSCKGKLLLTAKTPSGEGGGKNPKSKMALRHTRQVSGFKKNISHICPLFSPFSWVAFFFCWGISNFPFTARQHHPVVIYRERHTSQTPQKCWPQSTAALTEGWQLENELAIFPMKEFKNEAMFLFAGELGGDGKSFNKCWSIKKFPAWGSLSEGDSHCRFRYKPTSQIHIFPFATIWITII